MEGQARFEIPFQPDRDGKTRGLVPLAESSYPLSLALAGRIDTHRIVAADTGAKVIHGENPMANTYGDSVRMARACKGRWVQLTIAPQRRFGDAFVQVQDLLKAGTIGELSDPHAAGPLLAALDPDQVVRWSATSSPRKLEAGT